MKRLTALLLMLSFLSVSVTYAQLHRPPKPEPEPKNGWFGTIQAGYNFSFGDDSWNIGKDWKEARAGGVSLSVGKILSPLFGVRVKARYLELRNRVNLEVYNTFHKEYPDLFPNKGFYGFRVGVLQAEVMFNVTNLLRDRSTDHFFNAYLLAGAGENIAFNYESIVDDWDGTIPGLVYNVDTRSHMMPVGCVGMMLDFRVDNDLSLNIEALGSFTGDKLEGIKYEEPYDVYITFSVGATIHF